MALGTPLSPVRFAAKPFSQLSPLELYEILRLRAQVFIVEQHCLYQDIDGLDPRSVHLSGHRDGRLLAYARWYEAASERVLGRIAVHPQGRGEGLGRRLVEAALTAIGPHSVRIHAQAYLEDFYRSFGFESRGGPFEEDGIPHRLMVRLFPT